MVKFSFAYLVQNEELYSRKSNKKPSKNNGNMKAAIIDKIGKMMAEAMKEAICENEHNAYIDHSAGDFYFTVEVNEDDEIVVEVLNNETDKTDYPNVIAAIKAAIPDWSDVADDMRDEWQEMDEWQRNGFKDAADYYRWRYC